MDMLQSISACTMYWPGYIYYWQTDLENSLERMLHNLIITIIKGAVQDLALLLCLCVYSDFLLLHFITVHSYTSLILYLCPTEKKT